MIPEDIDGHIDIGRLEEELVRYASRPVKIASFSAASNVTGILTDTYAIADLLHRHGALSFWDFAAAAPYVEIEMSPNSTEHPLAYKDAIFFSPHKFVGGPGTPGVLVIRRELLANRVPDVVGGGTVTYVNPLEHAYVDDHEQREEAGTPAIIESIRAGLVMQLKEAVGVSAIRAHEESFWRRAGQAGVGVRAGLLHRQPAEAVGQRLGGPAEALFGPGRLGERPAGVDRDGLAGDVDLAGGFPVPADGGVVQPGVVGGHLRGVVIEDAPHDFLRDVPVDQTGARGCAATGAG